MKTRFAVFFLLLVGGISLAQEPAEPAAAPAEPAAAPAEPAAQAPVAPAPVAPRYPVQRWSVDAGTDALLVVDRRVPLVDITVQVPVGAASAWYREHSGEQAWTLQSYDADGALRARADALAVELNLSAGEHRSTLSVRALRRDADAVAALLRDVLTSASIDKDEAKRSVKGVKIGWESNLKDPEFRLSQAMARLFFSPGDPRRAPYEEPAAPAKDPKKLLAARDAMVQMAGRRIGFAGDIDRAEADRLARMILPPLASGPTDVGATWQEELGERPASFAEKMPALTQVYFALSALGIAYSDEDFPAFVVANHVLGGHFFSRLYVALRHEGGETYGARAGGGGGIEPGVYSLFTFTRVENRARTEEKLREVLSTFQRDGITEAERADAVSALQGERLIELQAPGDALDEVLRMDALGLPADFSDANLAAAAALSLEQVNAFIAEFYDPARFVMVTVEPE